MGEKAGSKVVLPFFWKFSDFKIYRNVNALFNPDGFFQICVFGTHSTLEGKKKFITHPYDLPNSILTLILDTQYQ